jgi:hypothetical protein
LIAAVSRLQCKEADSARLKIILIYVFSFVSREMKMHAMLGMIISLPAGIMNPASFFSLVFFRASLIDKLYVMADVKKK